MLLLVPELARQIPRWQSLVASIPFSVGKGVEIDIEESPNLLSAISMRFGSSQPAQTPPT